MAKVLPFSDYQREQEISYRDLGSKIVRANRYHTLRCGCEVKPGHYYFRAVALYEDVFMAEKHHASGLCLAGPTPPSPIGRH